MNSLHSQNGRPRYNANAGPDAISRPRASSASADRRTIFSIMTELDTQFFEPARIDHHVTSRQVRNAEADAHPAERKPGRIIGRSADVGQDHRADQRGRPKG